MGSNKLYEDSDKILGNVTLKGDLIYLPIEDYGAILGMDWLFHHYT
jgi:hypothetical protein